MKKHRQLVLVEFHNSIPFVELLESDLEITIDRAVKYLDSEHGIDEDRDSVTFLDTPDEPIDLDREEEEAIEDDDSDE